MRTEELLALGLFDRGSRVRESIEMLLARGREFSPRASGARVAMSALALMALAMAASLAPHWIAFAQAQPVFEVASVKPVKAPVIGEVMELGTPGGRFPAQRFFARRISLLSLLEYAYTLHPSQIAGPGWLGAENFDIEAKPEAAASELQIKLMLRSLLEDRFKLALRRETRQLPVYALVALRKGPKLRASSGGDPSLSVIPGQVAAQSERLSALVEILRGNSFFAGVVDRPVLDQSGITGVYAFKLEWTPDESQYAGRGGRTDRSGPSLFTAIEEQLGLKLEPQRGPVEILVVDHAERVPTGN
jgi:uncharacterized protein (TIGR03435 family)